MKKTVFYLALLIGILFSGCEEVIVLDLTSLSEKYPKG